MPNKALKDEAFGIVPILSRKPVPLFLLIQHQAGHWGFPKGHADAGETPIAAACREFEEETGISAYQLIDWPALVETYCFSKQGETVCKTVTYFTAFVPSDQVRCQEKEIRDFCWLPFSEAIEKLSFAQAKQVLMQVNQSLQRLT